MGNRPGADVMFCLVAGENNRETALPGECSPKLFGGDDFGDVIARLAGIRPPQCEYSDASEEAYRHYWGLKRAAAVACPVVFVNPCQEGDTSQAIAPREARFSFDWDDPMALLDMGIIGRDTAEWKATLEEWAKKLGLDPARIAAANPNGPQWRINVTYG